MTNPGMTAAHKKQIGIQQEYYKNTAGAYDGAHVNESKEHDFALGMLEAAIGLYGIRSILDIGAGTGRVARYLKNKLPDLKIHSIEPVRELREVGHTHGLTREELVEGDVTKLAFPDGAFDLVCEFGVLHHVKDPARAVAEMMRVSRKGIFISDSNNFGQGSYMSRTLKQLLNSFNLWKVADFVKTRGKGYTISEGDGLAYSYSVFNNYRQISDQCHVHLFNTQPSGSNLYRSAPHVALLGLKKSA